MEAQELAEKFKNLKIQRETDFQEVLKWCKEHYKDLDLTDKNQHYLYEKATTYLMKYRIGKWDRDDANTIVTFLAKKSAWKLGIDENVAVKILSSDEYKKIYGEKTSVKGECLNNGDSTFNITYSPEVVDNLLSNNYDQFLRGMQTVFHEVVHAQQNTVIEHSNIKGVEIPKTKKIYIMALETIARKYNPDFYHDNYAHLIKENHAEKFGLQKALETMKQYNPSLYQSYNQEVLTQRAEQYDRNFYESTTKLKTGREIDLMLQIDTLSSQFIEKHPDIISKYPILQVGYNSDGTKKDLRQLLTDRAKMLEQGKQSSDKIDELYEAIANHRNVLTGGLKGTKDELYTLDDYLSQTGSEDPFVYNLIRHRLEHKTKLSSEEIENFIERAHQTAAKCRAEKEEKEIIQEKEESIRDEVGDELAPETKAQQQERKDEETKWMQRIGSVAQEVDKTNAGVKGKQEVVKLTQELQAREKQEQVKLQEEQDQQSL